MSFSGGGSTNNYYVKANNSVGSTNNSNGVLSTTSPNCSGTLPGAFILTATPQCSGTSSQVRLSWTVSANAINYDVYQDGNLIAPNTINTQVIVSFSGAGSTNNYYVKANNSVGSTNNSNGTLSATSPNCNPLIVIDHNNPFEIKVLPNPSSGEYFLTANNIFNKEISIEILNLLGQQLYYTERKALTYNFNHTIDIKNSANGIYFIRITIEGELYIKRLIKK